MFFSALHLGGFSTLVLRDLLRSHSLQWLHNTGLPNRSVQKGPYPCVLGLLPVLCYVKEPRSDEGRSLGPSARAWFVSPVPPLSLSLLFGHFTFVFVVAYSHFQIFIL